MSSRDSLLLLLWPPLSKGEITLKITRIFFQKQRQKTKSNQQQQQKTVTAINNSVRTQEKNVWSKQQSLSFYGATGLLETSPAGVLSSSSPGVAQKAKSHSKLREYFSKAKQRQKTTATKNSVKTRTKIVLSKQQFLWSHGAIGDKPCWSSLILITRRGLWPQTEHPSGLKQECTVLVVLHLLNVYKCLTHKTLRQKLNIFFFFCIASNFNILKTLTLLVHAWLFWCFHNPPNSNMDYRIFNVRM